MFLDPSNYVILDGKLMRIGREDKRTVLHDVNFSAKGGMIRIPAANEAAYERWCQICRRLASECFGSHAVRAVDLERGIFHSVDTGRAGLAAEILTRASTSLIGST